jgi:hypothetical protein
MSKRGRKQVAEERFGKVHSPGAIDPATYLRKENAELKNQVMQLNQELMNRAAPTVGNLIDAVNNLVLIAAQGNAGARALLRTLVKSLDAAREAASPITIVKNGS